MPPAAALRSSRLDRTLLALADPTRRRLVERIRREPQRASDLGAGLPITRPAVSRHLRVLREAGIVTALPRGREVVYGLAVDQRGIEEARAYFDEISRGWDRALAAFKAFAEAQSEEES
jgi:DNA-binding transcriptional ArsR family regulator